MNQNENTRDHLEDENEASATTNSIDTKDEGMMIVEVASETVDERVVIDEGVAHALAAKKRHTKGGDATSIKRNDSLNSGLASDATTFEELLHAAYTDGTDLTYEEGDDDDESDDEIENIIFPTLKSEDSSDEDESTQGGSDEDESILRSGSDEWETAITSLPSTEKSMTLTQKESERQTRVAENLYKKIFEKELRAAHNGACKNLKVSTLTPMFPYARTEG